LKAGERVYYSKAEASCGNCSQFRHPTDEQLLHLDIDDGGAAAVNGLSLNPLSPNIHIQILQTDLLTFPFRMSKENLIKDQSVFPLVIILFILIT